MFKMSWAKIDKFYPILVSVMILLAALFILTFRAIFSAFQTAYEPAQGLNEAEGKIDKAKLDESYNFVFNKQATESAGVNEEEVK
jgi:hypothetical protein